MGFSLVIAKGEREGEKLAFEREARIGRNDDNDLVFDLPGVSRVHARVFERNGAHFAEDLGSVNGTKVNGSKISGEASLRHGDSIAVGPAVLGFLAPKPLEDEPTRTAGAHRPPLSDADLGFPGPSEGPAPAMPLESAPTRLLELSDISTAVAAKAASASVKAPRPSSVGSRALAPLPAALKNLPPPPLEEATVLRDPIAEETVLRGPIALPTAKDPKGAVAPKKKKPIPTAAASKDAAAVVMRARRKREATESLGKLLAYHWSELSARAKLSLLGTGVLLLGGLAVALVLFFKPPSHHDTALGPEPTRLGPTPIATSFGLGSDVTWRHMDRKVFHFIFTTPTRAVAVLHYQASGISKDEVSINLNGVDQGSIPADTTSTDERDLERVLAPADLRKGQQNELVFDDLHNPPGEDTWKIWNIWVEIIPIPELPREQLEASVREYMARAKQFYDQRDVGSSNLFLSWKSYRMAWLTLEALGDRSDSYREARFWMARLGKVLNEKCGALMLAAQQAVVLHHPDKAKQVLESVSAYFPTTEQRCHNLALERMNDYGL